MSEDHIQYSDLTTAVHEITSRKDFAVRLAYFGLGLPNGHVKFF